MWLPTEGPGETAMSWFVEGRPDDLVFWRGNYVRNELPSACVVVSVATGVERFRLPRCRIPASWIADNTMYAPPAPPTVPPFLIRGPTNPCDDDVLVPWAEAGAPPSPVTPVPKETPVLSYPWGCCRQEPKVDQEQPLVRELRPQTGMQIDDLAASPDGSAVAAVFSGPILGTVGLRSASGRWLSFVRGEVWDIRMKVLPALSPDSRWVAVKSDTDGQAYGESRVLILDVRSGEVRHNFLGPCKFPKSFAWSSDSKLLAVGDEERSCVFELGKGLLWTKTFTKPEECFRCRKIPEFAMGGRVVIVRATEYMPAGAVLEVRSGRVLTSGKALGPFEETEGKLRVVIDLFADHPRIDTLDSSFVVQSRPPSSKELDHLLQDQENPVAVKYRDKLCVRDGYIFPSRFCAGQKPF
jgi:hypothetical protein